MGREGDRKVTKDGKEVSRAGVKQRKKRRRGRALFFCVLWLTELGRFGSVAKIGCTMIKHTCTETVSISFRVLFKYIKSHSVCNYRPGLSVRASFGPTCHVPKLFFFLFS